MKPAIQSSRANDRLFRNPIKAAVSFRSEAIEIINQIEAGEANVSIAHRMGLPGDQKGSGAAMNSIGTSPMNPFSHSAQYFIPACSDTTWPSTMRAFF